MAWNDKIKLENFIVCGAPYGGPIAMILDSKKNITPELELMKSKLFIKTSSGNPIAEIDWENEKSIVGMGWSDLEHLITVLENGKFDDLFFSLCNDSWFAIVQEM